MDKKQALPQARRAGKLGVALVYALVLALIGLAWAWLMGGIYPQRLALSAPDLTEALPAWALSRAGANRADAWRLVITACHALGLAVMLLVQLVWRAVACRGKWPLCRVARRAIRRYRAAMLVILAAEAALGWWLWQAGLRHVENAGLWDYAVCLAPLALCVPGAAVLCRWAAPGVISGRHGYFHRL